MCIDISRASQRTMQGPARRSITPAGTAEVNANGAHRKDSHIGGTGTKLPRPLKVRPACLLSVLWLLAYVHTSHAS